MHSRLQGKTMMSIIFMYTKNRHYFGVFAQCSRPIVRATILGRSLRMMVRTVIICRQNCYNLFFKLCCPTEWMIFNRRTINRAKKSFPSERPLTKFSSVQWREINSRYNKGIYCCFGGRTRWSFFLVFIIRFRGVAVFFPRQLTRSRQGPQRSRETTLAATSQIKTYLFQHKMYFA